MKKRIIIKIYGKVQGVFFRDATRKKAESLGLTGWARNEDDGSVKIVAEGVEENLKELIEWCRAGGPEYAEVEKIKTEWHDFKSEFSNFTIGAQPP